MLDSAQPAHQPRPQQARSGSPTFPSGRSHCTTLQHHSMPLPPHNSPATHWRATPLACSYAHRQLVHSLNCHSALSGHPLHPSLPHPTPPIQPPLCTQRRSATSSYPRPRIAPPESWHIAITDGHLTLRSSRCARQQGGCGAHSFSRLSVLGLIPSHPWRAK